MAHPVRAFVPPWSCAPSAHAAAFVCVAWGWLVGGLVGRRCRLVLCGVGLTVAFGAMVLVPFTILGHEAMASYGDSWYVKWISYSLILGTLPFHLLPPSPRG